MAHPLQIVRIATIHLFRLAFAQVMPESSMQLATPQLSMWQPKSLSLRSGKACHRWLRSSKYTLVKEFCCKLCLPLDHDISRALSFCVFQVRIHLWISLLTLLQKVPLPGVKLLLSHKPNQFMIAILDQSHSWHYRTPLMESTRTYRGLLCATTAYEK